MIRKGRLDLNNSRLQLPEPVRVVDSLDFMRYDPIRLNDCGAHIPFANKSAPAKESAFLAWKRGKMAGGGSGDAPLVDHRGHYFEIAKACELGSSPLKISTREYGEHDYRVNETARIYYCQKKRINTPAMNRVLDNTHDVRGETMQSRVEAGLVHGGSWETTGREARISSSRVGPGDYNVSAFEAKYGPSSSNLLQFLSGPSGRDVDEANRQPTKADRIRSRRLLSSAGACGEGGFGDDEVTARPQTSGLLCARSSLSAVGATSFAGGGDRWKSPVYRVEKYVKTTGAKLAPDYDAAQRAREKVPLLFPTMPQRWEPKMDHPDIEVFVDCGNKMSLATAARLSPVKYSVAFRSKEPVGMHIPLPTSPPHVGPGAFTFKPSLEVIDPTRASCAFAPRTSSFKAPPETSGSEMPVPAFSESNRSGPIFSKDGTGAGLVLKIKMKHQIKTLYPRLGKKLFFKPKPIVQDPFAYLKPKIK